MNAERLRELVDFLLEAEGRLSIQSRMETVQNALQNLSNGPADPSFQQQAVHALDDLEKSLVPQFSALLTPAQAGAIAEIGAAPWFSSELPQGLRASLRDNGATPAVTSQRASQLTNERRQYVETLRNTADNLARLGIEKPKTSAGAAELGLLIPRDLFGNKLGTLSKELHTLNRIVNIFSEVATGEVEGAEVHQISTSDPLFFLGLDVRTVAMIAGSVTWLLATWKQALEIKELRIKAKALGFSAAELRGFEAKVNQRIDTAIEDRIKALLPQLEGQEDGRAKELAKGLDWAMRALLARIERGLTVEVRFLPPPAQAAEGGDTAQDGGEAQAFKALTELAPALDFPRPQGEPMIALPPPDPDAPTDEDQNGGAAVATKAAE